MATEQGGQAKGGSPALAPSPWPRWSVVVVYAIAMAWLEAAVVLYLRTLVGRLDPYQPHPLPLVPILGMAELIREAATLVMLGTVGWLAGQTWRSRLAYAVVAFGVWDIFYYVFLRPLTAWPNSLLDWDILFLLPLPWWGPVLAPVLIALLMVVGGSLVAFRDTEAQPFWPSGRALGICAAGVVLALYVFMADAIRIAGQGEAALRALLPVRFEWRLFALAWVLMAWPVAELLLKVRRPPATDPAASGRA